MYASTIIPLPANSFDFETRCRVLFSCVLNDPGVKMFGTSGVAQSGIDLLGRKNEDANHLVGVQCKLKTKGDKLTRAEAAAEIKQALAWTPPLREYYIVTTAPDDPDLDKLAAETSQHQLAAGRRIDVHIWGWNMLQQIIREHPRAERAFDPGHSATTERIEHGNQEILMISRTILASQEAGQSCVFEMLSDVLKRFDGVGQQIADSSGTDALEAHLDRQVDQYRALVNEGRPATARSLLEALERDLPASASARIRARIRSNLGWSLLRLGDDVGGGRLLQEAYVLNPDDPRHVANKVLAHVLNGEFEEAIEFGRQHADSEKASEALFGCMLYAANRTKIDDPLSLVPERFRTASEVYVGLINFHRHRENVNEWTRLAAEGAVRYPDNNLLQREAAEAVFARLLRDRQLDASVSITETTHAEAAHACNVLEAQWDKVKHYENAGQQPFLALACNASNLARAMGRFEKSLAIAREAERLAPNDKHVLFAASQACLALEDAESALVYAERMPDCFERTGVLMQALSALGCWDRLRTELTPERRAALPPREASLANAMIELSAIHTGKEQGARELIEKVVSDTSVTVGVLAAAVSKARTVDIDWAHALLDMAMAKVNAGTPYVDRIMLSDPAFQLGRADAIVQLLEGRISLNRKSSELSYLAWAYTTHGVPAKAREFFNGLPENVRRQPHFKRAEGFAYFNRGDMHRAESTLREAIDIDPTDLRTHLAYIAALTRLDRRDQVPEHVATIAVGKLNGTPMDRMRLAQIMRNVGMIEKACALRYATARDNINDAEVAIAYIGSMIPDEGGGALAWSDTIEVDHEFVLATDDGEEIRGVIEEGESRPFDERYSPDDPLARAVMGKKVGDEVFLDAGLTQVRRYSVIEVTPKYIALFNRISSGLSYRFANSQGLYKVRTEGDNIQPFLDEIRAWAERDRELIDLYLKTGLPLRGVARALGRCVIEFASQVRSLGEPIRTCLGNLPERQAAIRAVIQQRKNGAVLDTYTAWSALELGILPALKRYFGRLMVPQSVLDDFLQWREFQELNRDREYMRIGWTGEHFVRHIVTPEETARAIELMTERIDVFKSCCEVMPVDGPSELSHDVALVTQVLGSQTVDPVCLALEHDALLLSEDLHFRRLAREYGIMASAWLQPALMCCTKAKEMSVEEFSLATGMLAAMDHGHVWLDNQILSHLLVSKDPAAWLLFDQASRYIGGANVDISSHIAVVCDFGRTVWAADVPNWQKGRALGRLLERLVRFAPWQDTLAAVCHELQGSHLGGKSLAYIADWQRGHFLVK